MRVVVEGGGAKKGVSRTGGGGGGGVKVTKTCVVMMCVTLAEPCMAFVSQNIQLHGNDRVMKRNKNNVHWACAAGNWWNRPTDIGDLLPSLPFAGQ